MSDIAERIRDRIHDAPMQTERLLDEAEKEIRRLRRAMSHYADWIEEIYGNLPRDRAPGPPIQLLEDMRNDVAPPTTPPQCQ